MDNITKWDGAFEFVSVVAGEYTDTASVQARIDKKEVWPFDTISLPTGEKMLVYEVKEDGIYGTIIED